MLREKLDHIEILYDRGMYREGQKLLKKAKKIAYSFDNYLNLFGLLEWEKRIAKAMGREVTNKMLDPLKKEALHAIGKYSNIWNYSILNAKMEMKHIENRFIRNEKQRKQYATILANPFFKDQRRADTFWSKLYYYHAMNFYYFAKSDHVGREKVNEKIIRLMEENPQQIYKNPAYYLPVLYNLITDKQVLLKFDELEHLLEKFEKAGELPIDRDKMPMVEFLIFVYGYQSRLAMHLKKAEYEKGMSLMKGLQEGMVKYEASMPKESKLLLCYNAGYICFGAGKYDQALAWLNHFTLSPDAQTDLDIFNRFLVMVTWFEKGDLDHLESLILSTKRFLIRTNYSYKLEGLLIEFIQKELFRVSDRGEIITIFGEMKRKVDKLIKDPYEKLALEYIDFSAWLQSKIENRSFAEVMKEKLFR